MDGCRNLIQEGSVECLKLIEAPNNNVKCSVGICDACADQCDLMWKS